MSAVGARRRVEDERTDSVLVDDDLVQSVLEHFAAVAEPEHVWVRAAGDDTVEARHAALRHLDVRRDLAERWPEVRLRHAAEFPVVGALRRTESNNANAHHASCTDCAYRIYSAAQYLSQRINRRVNARTLHSTATPLLIQPFARTDFAKRSFRCAAPSVWNSLAASVIGSNSLSVFKSRLKAFLFRMSFNYHTQPTDASASEITTLWLFTNMLIIIIIIIILPIQQLQAR